MHDTTCLLSILIPAHNAAAYVGECLTSLLTQWRPGVELVVVDDGSTDSTGAVLAAIGRRHPESVRIHRRDPNRGVAATRNELVRLARGDYLWFIDADDTMAAGAIDKLLDVVGRHDPDLVLCDYDRTGQRGMRRCSSFDGPRRTIIRDPSVVLAGLFEAGQMHPWSKISRRSLWAEPLEFPDGRVFEDVAVMPALVSRAATTYHVPEPWVRYRKWSGSIMATMNPRKCVDLVRASADFPDHIRRQRLRLSPRAVFASRHYAARHFCRAVRHLGVALDPAACRSARAECLAWFMQAIEGETAWLMRQYLRRGWLLRWSRLRHHIRQAAGPRVAA